MKKLYLFLFTVLCFAFVSKADVTYKFNFTVEDPENVTIKICDYDDPTKVLKEFDVKEGLNSFEYEIIGYSYANLFVNTTEGRILKAHKEDGSISYDVADNALKIYLSPWYYGYGDPEYTYTIKTFDEASFRPNTVKVTLDNPEGIRMTLRGGSVINADKTEYEIPFNDVYEDMLTIRKAVAEELIYKITANGEEVVKEGLEYNIPLVDRSDIDDIKYITDIVITQEFPEDMLCNIKFVFTNDDPGCITSVTYGGEPIEDFANEDVFTVRPGKELVANFNRNDYKIISYQKNDKDPYESSYISIMSEVIGSDFTLTVTAEKYEVYTATIIASNPEQIKMERGYPSYAKVDLVAGENQITFRKDGYDDKVTVAALDGFDITRIYDETYDKETVVSTMYSTTIYLDENSKIYIDSEPIVRNEQILVYVDDTMVYNNVPNFSRGGELIPAVNGYQFISYREKDNYITFMATGAYDGKYYKNGVDVKPGF
ncbi:MAG: hypothetical protein K2J10_07735 [Muribaculaceae bacterium]|nr:hypothetical protein [Muribaculaceae bacterium]